MSLQLLETLTRYFRNAPGIGRRMSRPSPPDRLDELVNDLKRELYGMNVREEAAVRHILSNTGQRITICRDTIAFGRKGKPCVLEKGSHVTIPGVPLQIDADQGVQVVVIDRKNQYLAMRLPDYIRDVCTGQQGG